MSEHEQEDAVIEQVVRSTVGRQLDLQQGKSAAAFARMLAQPQRAGEIERGGERGGMAARGSEVRRLRFWAGTASALAACLACVVGLQLWTGAGGAQIKPGTEVAKPAVASAAPVMQQEEFRRDIDAGTIVMEDSPIRVVRQQTVKHTRWFDPQEKATYSVTEPIERVGYERLQPY